jgi:hypothetical protein
MSHRPCTHLLLIAGSLALACGRRETPSAPADARLNARLEERSVELDARTTNVGTLVPDLAFTDVDGRAGRPPTSTAIRSWTRFGRGLPGLEAHGPGARARIEDEYHLLGVAFLFLDLSPQDTPEEIRADAAEQGFDGPAIHDVEQALGVAPGALTTTESLVPDGARTLSIAARSTTASVVRRRAGRGEPFTLLCATRSRRS